MNTKRKHLLSRMLAWLTAFAMAVCLLPVNLWQTEAATTLKNPTVTDNGDGTSTTTWDCVYFGRYPQSSDGNGEFKKEPIKWRVLSVDGDDAFLLADQSLDCQPYNTEYTAVTWETCTLRSWLNDEFIGSAFTDAEQNIIYTTNVVNEDNDNTEGGNNTQDKVYLLSIGEVLNTAYGFSIDKSEDDEARWAKNTDYAENQGATEYFGKYSGNGCWWLRSPGFFGSLGAADVFEDGSVGTNIDVSNDHDAVRPALHLNLSSGLWSYAETVSSEREITDAKKEQSIAGESSFTKTYGDEAFNLNASAETDLSYESSDTNVITISNDGTVTIKGAGTATITITAAETEDYNTSTKTVTVKVNKASISGKTTTLSPISYTYDGKIKKPTVTIAGLKEGTDFTVTYKDSAGNAVISPINAGKYEVIITGTSNYEGILTKEFTIEEGQKPEQMERIAVTISGVKFYVDTKTDGTSTISSIAKTNKKTITIKDTVTIKGVEYEVTAIGGKAFKNCKNVRKIIIPASVKLIKKNAFAGAKKLKQIVFKGKKAITIKKGAFKGLNTKKMTAIFNKKMRKKEFEKAKKALKKAGFKGKIKKTGK